MALIENEVITPDGTETDFELANPYKEGTVMITIDGKLTYEFYEQYDDADTAPQTVVFDRAPSADRAILVSYYPADEPNTLNQIRYLTPAQAKRMTRVAAVGTTDDAALEKLIREAETLVDRFVSYPYAGYHGQVGQKLLFPRQIDEDKQQNSDRYPVDYVGIPYDITEATLYALDNLVLGGDVAADDGAGVKTSERLGDYSYQRAESKGAASRDAGLIIGKRSRALLAKYRKAYRGLDIGSRFSNEQLLNSRERFTRSIH